MKSVDKSLIFFSLFFLFLLLFLLITSITIILPITSAEILEVYPNPYDEEVEYVKVRCYEHCTFTDGESVFEMDNGTYIIARNSTAFEKRFNIKADFEGIRLSNSGEEIILEDGIKRDVFNWEMLNYKDEGVIYFKKNNSWDFKYVDWSSFKPISDNVSGKIIVTPANYILKGEGIVASYTIIKDVFDGKFEFAVDASPVGGIPLNEYELTKKYNFHFLDSNSYKNFHAKYAVIDNDEVVITTENWKWDKRGVIVELKSEKIANLLRKVFYNDLKYESNPRKFTEFKKAGGGKGEEFSFYGNVKVYIMPDENPVFSFISKSNKRLYIASPYIDFRWFEGSPLLDSILNAGKRGCEIRILLNDYKRNYEIVNYLNELKKDGIDIEARVVKSPEFEELHGKYIISDDDVLITSANLNKYGLKLNREIAIVIYNDSVSDFMANIFMKDFEGENKLSYLVFIVFGVALFVIFSAFKKFK